MTHSHFISLKNPIIWSLSLVQMTRTQYNLYTIRCQKGKGRAFQKWPHTYRIFYTLQLEPIFQTLPYCYIFCGCLLSLINKLKYKVNHMSLGRDNSRGFLEKKVVSQTWCYYIIILSVLCYKKQTQHVMAWRLHRQIWYMVKLCLGPRKSYFFNLLLAFSLTKIPILTIFPIISLFFFIFLGGEIFLLSKLVKVQDSRKCLMLSKQRARIKMEIPVLVWSLKTSIFNLTSSQMD